MTLAIKTWGMSFCISGEAEQSETYWRPCTNRATATGGKGEGLDLQDVGGAGISSA